MQGFKVEQLADENSVYMEFIRMEDSDRIYFVTKGGLLSFDLKTKESTWKVQLEEGTFSENEFIEISSDYHEYMAVFALVGKKKVVFLWPEDGEIRSVALSKAHPKCCGFWYKGLLHIGYNGYLLVQSMSDDQFNRIETTNKLDDGQVKNLGCDVLAFDNYYTYVADTHFFAKIRNETVIETIVLNEQLNTYSSSDDPSCIILDNPNQAERIWLGRDGGGLVLIKDDELQFFGGAEKRGGIENLRDIVQIRRDAGDLWVATPNAMFSIIEDEEIIFEEYKIRGLVTGKIMDFRIHNGQFMVLSAVFYQDEEEEYHKDYYVNIFSKLALVALKTKEVREARSTIGYPTVRISYTRYGAASEISSDFWHLKEHELMAEVKVEDYRDFQKQSIAEIQRLATTLGEDLEPFITVTQIKWDILVPCYAEKIKFQDRDAWVMVYNWEVEPGAKASHIAILVIDEDTKEILVYEQCC